MKKIALFTAVLASIAVMAVCTELRFSQAASVCIPGDINRDERVSVGDMVILRNYLLGRYGLNSAQASAADINGDFVVDIMDAAAMQDIIVGSMNRLPDGTWIADRAGVKRCFSFADGGCSAVMPDGSSDYFSVETEGELAVFTSKKDGTEKAAFVTWTGEESFVLKWEDGAAETFRYVSDKKLEPAQLISGQWHTDRDRAFEISGLGGKLTDENGGISRFEYFPDGGDILFHFGSTENNTEGKILHTDSMHFTVTWSDGTDEKFTRREIVTRNGVTYVNGVLIANKSYSLPSGYNPSGILPEAQKAFDSMKSDAAMEGVSLWICSGFRSYSYQDTLYSSYVSRDGRAAADTYSARAGHSEHQTGLALDVNYASDAYSDTPEMKWLAENCVKYGFIVRYPKGKQDITGYKYEPWHIRYIGRQLAEEVAASGLSLEEFLGIDSEYGS